MSVDSLIWDYESDRPIIAVSPNGGTRLVIALALFDDGVSYADDGILDPLSSGQPIHHIHGDFRDTEDGFECGAHRFTVMRSDDTRIVHWEAACRAMLPNPSRYRHPIQDRLAELRR